MPAMAFVTGGSRGIGAAICRRLAGQGYAVAVCYAHNREAADRVVAEIEQAGGQAAAFALDVAEPERIEAAVAEAEAALGALAVMVVNAGISGAFRRLVDYDVDEIESVLRVNTLAPMVCAQAAIRRLATSSGGPGGAIVIMSSVAARLGGGGAMVPYAASKGAMNTLITGLGNELAVEGIRVNGVAPGIIDTDMPPPALRDAAADSVPMQRMGKPEEIANAVAWLISDEASYMTGQTITVSGGR